MTTRYAAACNGYLSYPMFETVEEATKETFSMRDKQGEGSVTEVFVLVPLSEYDEKEELVKDLKDRIRGLENEVDW